MVDSRLARDSRLTLACVAGVKRGGGTGGGREFGQKTEDLPPPLYTPATQARARGWLVLINATTLPARKMG